MTTNFAGIADRYRIEHELGAGGMATVYLAEIDRRDQRYVFIKVLAWSSPRRRWPRALLGLRSGSPPARATGTPIDSGESDGVLWYAECVHRGRIAAPTALARQADAVDRALRITRQIAAALTTPTRRA